MKKYLALVVVAVLIGGCSGRTDELERQNAELRNKSSELSADLSSRDAYIDTVTQSINEIYANLEGVRSNEKMIASETNGIESGKQVTNREVRERILSQLSTINENMAGNRKKLADVQAKMASYRTQFSGLKKMVATLKKTIEDREQAIAALETKVHGLESDLTEKTRVVSEKEAVITAQTTKINTAYYVVGKRSDLEQKGIIAKDGGFLWGLLGSSTILASGVDPKYFTPINKVEERTIQVNGKIDEVIPKRSPEFYTKTLVDNNQSMITIAEPTAFWQDQYLVIITD
jgi:PBP1b-binding outer membrane lipoprotein LpoB